MTIRVVIYTGTTGIEETEPCEMEMRKSRLWMLVCFRLVYAFSTTTLDRAVSTTTAVRLSLQPNKTYTPDADHTRLMTPRCCPPPSPLDPALVTHSADE